LLTLGWGIAVWITIGVLLGRWADGHWGWQPWGTLGGALLGIAGAGWTMYRVVRRLDRRDRKNSD
jgi:F0F1-type ATP synthase assembly protein I